MKTLRENVRTLGRALEVAPRGTPRQRGRALQARRARWFGEHPLCVICERAGRTRAAAELDHVIPLWNGGRDDDSNVQGLCITCHDAKSEREARERGGGAG